MRLEDIIPRPPWSRGLQISNHRTMWCFLLVTLTSPEKAGLDRANLVVQSLV